MLKLILKDEELLNNRINETNLIQKTVYFVLRM